MLFGEPFHVAGIIETGGEEEDRAFVRLEVLQRLTHRAGEVDSVEVSALTKPEDAFAVRDPAQMTPAEYDRWYCTPYVSSIAHQIEEALPMAVARPIRRVADNEGKVLDKIRGLMLLISAAALASAALTVWSVMATTVLERRAEIAIMQATGAANWLVAALVRSRGRGGRSGWRLDRRTGRHATRALGGPIGISGSGTSAGPAGAVDSSGGGRGGARGRGAAVAARAGDGAGGYPAGGRVMSYLPAFQAALGYRDAALWGSHSWLQSRSVELCGNPVGRTPWSARVPLDPLFV